MSEKEAVEQALSAAVAVHKTQKRVAELLGVSQPTVSQWRKGIVIPSLRHYLELLELGKPVRLVSRAGGFARTYFLMYAFAAGSLAVELAQTAQCVLRRRTAHNVTLC